MKSLLFAAALALTATPALAETVAIVNARIETVGKAGTITSGTVVIRDGKIAAVGEGVAAPAGARVIDAKGGVVTPGFIAASSNLTVSEVEAVSETRDDRSGKLSAGFDIQYGVNPNSAVIPLARQSGLTTAVITPLLTRGGGGHSHDHGGSADAGLTGGGGVGEADPYLFGGQAAIVTLGQSRDPVRKARVAVVLDLGEAGARNAGGSRGAALVLVRSALDDARAYARNRGAYEQGSTREFGLSRIDLEALVPVVQGRTPLLIRVSRAADIRQALRLAKEQNIRIIIEGAEEGWMVADELAAAGVAVLIDPQAALPQSFETLGARLDNAARLRAAGVTVVIVGSRDYSNLRQARFNAGTAVAYGLPYADALASLTANPARVWGIADRVGSIEVGKDADIVLWNGDPLETSSWPLAVFVGGVQQPEDNRAFQLRDRYAAPPAAYPPAYTKP
ncbi:MAG: amidohydrolase family protein [Caulobacter sp.]|jgi:imidazolonepropionase-like amidohydrolase